MHDFRPLILFFFIFFFIPTLLRADTLYLKNGQRAEGLITREGADQIEFELGDASMTFTRTEIDHIERSSPEETADLVARWEKHKKKSRDLDLIATEQRKKSLEEWRVRSSEEEAFKKANERERQKMEANTRRVPVTIDPTGHIALEALINGEVPASMVVDTGAPMLLLTADVALKLGYKVDNKSQLTTIVLLNGKHTAAPVILKSVTVGEAYETDVPAYVLLDEDKEMAKTFKNGLLGLSFLSRFHVSLDTNHGQLLLRKD